MRFITTICCILFLSVGYAQIPNLKRIDSIVKAIEAKKTLVVNTVSDTFGVSYSKLLTIVNVKFYSTKNKLSKAIFTNDYYQKDSISNNIPTQLDVFYFNDDLLIKVISKDYDQLPAKNIVIYLNEKDLKKYIDKKTVNASRYEGVNYFIELGYNLLNEFKALSKK